MLEVELKVRIADPDTIRKNLFDNNAAFESEVRERDLYFNAPHRDFEKTDEALRLRYHGDSVTLTYKGPKLKEYMLKARTELNVRVESGEATESILGLLGFEKVAEVLKDREYFHYKGALVSIDRVEGLGSFVEIEVAGDEMESDPHKKIEEIAKELGVEGKPILESYLELLLSTR